MARIIRYPMQPSIHKQIYLLTDAILIWILQVLKKGGIYREFTVVLKQIRYIRTHLFVTRNSWNFLS